MEDYEPHPIIDGRAFVIHDDGSKTLRMIAADLAEAVNYILENDIAKKRLISMA